MSFFGGVWHLDDYGNCFDNLGFGILKFVNLGVQNFSSSEFYFVFYLGCLEAETKIICLLYTASD